MIIYRFQRDFVIPYLVFFLLFLQHFVSSKITKILSKKYFNICLTYLLLLCIISLAVKIKYFTLVPANHNYQRRENCG